MTDKSETYVSLAKAAKTAQRAAKDLDVVLGQLESRHVNLAQAALKLGTGWAKTYGDLDARGKALVSVFDLLGKSFLGQGQSPNVSSGEPTRSAAAAPSINVQLVTNSIADMQRGESQISSLLARAVTRGMREL